MELVFLIVLFKQFLVMEIPLTEHAIHVALIVLLALPLLNVLHA